jgi:hypothetical protein
LFRKRSDFFSPAFEDSGFQASKEGGQKNRRSGKPIDTYMLATIGTAVWFLKEKQEELEGSRESGG